jgi:hypothetical protein
MVHHHHHHPGNAHPSPKTNLSLLQLSAFERLAMSGAAVALLWLAVWWAMS